MEEISFFFAVPAFVVRSFHCRKFFDNKGQSTEINHSLPVYRITASYQILFSENSDQHSSVVQGGNIFFTSSVHEEDNLLKLSFMLSVIFVRFFGAFT